MLDHASGVLPNQSLHKGTRGLIVKATDLLMPFLGELHLQNSPRWCIDSIPPRAVFNSSDFDEEIEEDEDGEGDEFEDDEFEEDFDEIEEDFEEEEEDEEFEDDEFEDDEYNDDDDF